MFSLQHGNDLAVAAAPLAVARKHYKTTVEYLLMKVEQKDWHGVADAAMDIRDLIAAHPDVELPEPHGILPSEITSWTCGACGIQNAAFRHSCLKCGWTGEKL